MSTCCAAHKTTRQLQTLSKEKFSMQSTSQKTCFVQRHSSATPLCQASPTHELYPAPTNTSSGTLALHWNCSL